MFPGFVSGFRTVIKGDLFHRSAGLDFLHALGDDPVAGRQARGDEPLVANSPVKVEHPLLNFAGSVHNQSHWIALWIARHGLLGNQNALLIDAFFHHRANEHARQENPVRIGENHPQDHRCGCRIHRDVAELKGPLQRILRAVFEDEIHLVRVCPVAVHPLFLQAALQSEQFGGGLGHIHINGVQLLNGGQGRGLISRRDGAIRHRGSSNPAGDWRDHTRVSKVDAGRLHHRLVIRNIGHGLFQGGSRIVKVLLGNRFVGKGFLVAIRPQLKGGQIGFSPAKSGPGIVERRLEGSGIDLVKRLAGLDIRTFRKQAFLYEAVDLGPDFGDAIRRACAPATRLSAPPVAGQPSLSPLLAWEPVEPGPGDCRRSKTIRRKGPQGPFSIYKRD